MTGEGCKRYRVLGMQFDTRALLLDTPIQEEWDPQVRKQWKENKTSIERSIEQEFGLTNAEQKLTDFREFGVLPFSVLSFHNAFFAQARAAFVVGAYYPALVGVCALGERILNHLLLSVRDSFKSRPEYKRVHSKQSMDDWNGLISVLTSWNVLRPVVATKFSALEKLRHGAVHFRPETDVHTRDEALAAVTLMREIIVDQFGAFGDLPWFIEDTPGESYVRKDFEADPFVRAVYLPNARLLGYEHVVEGLDPKEGLVIRDDYDYGDEEITDEEFVRRLRLNQQPMSN